MTNKLMIASIGATILMASTLSASSEYIPNLNEKIAQNTKMIKEYKGYIADLVKENKKFKEIKAKNPKLYVEKPLYEETKKAYIYRIKLNGAKAKNLKFTIKNHIASVEMYLKIERNDSNGYYSSSQNFYQEFTIPKNVEEDNISNKVDGNYFEIIMPKK